MLLVLCSVFWFGLSMVLTFTQEQRPIEGRVTLSSSREVTGCHFWQAAGLEANSHSAFVDWALFYSNPVWIFVGKRLQLKLWDLLGPLLLNRPWNLIFPLFNETNRKPSAPVLSHFQEWYQSRGAVYFQVVRSFNTVFKSDQSHKPCDPPKI